MSAVSTAKRYQMPSKRLILQRLGELEGKMKELRSDIEEHYKPKDIIIKNDFSDIEIQFFENGWAVISQNNDEFTNISLGSYPNARWRVIEEALQFAKSQQGESKC
jgi:hypothetical protein